MSAHRADEALRAGEVKGMVSAHQEGSGVIYPVSWLYKCGSHIYTGIKNILFTEECLQIPSYIWMLHIEDICTSCRYLVQVYMDTVKGTGTEI